MTYEIHYITIGGKERRIPKGTIAHLKKSLTEGCADVELKFPGQSNFTKYKNIKIENGILNIPAKLVFLSYSTKTNAEKKFVQKLSDLLWEDGIMSWWDKQNLLPGETWESRIHKAIESSDYFISILSQNALITVGYIHKELKKALEKQELYPESKKYIIPILFDDCTPPDSIKHLHWINQKEDPNWYKKVKESIMSE
jgi:hypothetical protein